jgi:acyl-CoA reductase-like NAD-dependent aldehyde dehydrogenase
VARPSDDGSPLDLELRRERAQALSRAGERLEAALRELAEAEAALGATPGPALEAARDEAMSRAGERLWFLVVQREAMGLRDHRMLDDVWPIPAGVHAAMGPRRRNG